MGKLPRTFSCSPYHRIAAIEYINASFSVLIDVISPDDPLPTSENHDPRSAAMMNSVCYHQGACVPSDVDASLTITVNVITYKYGENNAKQC